MLNVTPLSASIYPKLENIALTSIPDLRKVHVLDSFQMRSEVGNMIVKHVSSLFYIFIFIYIYSHVSPDCSRVSYFRVLNIFSPILSGTKAKHYFDRIHYSFFPSPFKLFLIIYSHVFIGGFYKYCFYISSPQIKWPISLWPHDIASLKVSRLRKQLSQRKDIIFPRSTHPEH